MYSSSLTSCLLLVVGLTVTACCAEEVPVFVWGDLQYKSRSANPLEHVTSAELISTLRSQFAQKPLVVAFVEETLSVEDLSSRDESGATALSYLRSQLPSSLYLPAVQNPVEAITKVADDKEVQLVRLTASGLSSPIDPSSSVVMVELSDAGADEARSALLRRHDSFMRSTVGKLSEKGDVIAVYTGRYPSWTKGDEEMGRFRRHLMQAEAPVVSNSTFNIQVYNLTNLILALGSVTVTSGSSTSTVTIPAAGPEVVVNNRTITVTFQDSAYTVTLGVHSMSDGYWALSEASVAPAAGGAEQRYMLDSVYALDGFSYHCNRIRMQSPNGTYIVTLNSLQLQPFFSGNATRFGDSFDCIGFFSVPIWSGIFVLTIILAIFFYGVASMMDIRTMDRFDDPKGKTITINATD